MTGFHLRQNGKRAIGLILSSACFRGRSLFFLPPFWPDFMPDFLDDFPDRGRFAAMAIFSRLSPRLTFRPGIDRRGGFPGLRQVSHRSSGS